MSVETNSPTDKDVRRRTFEMADVIAIEGIGRSRHQLHMQFRADDLRFTTTYWYGDVFV